MLFHVVLDSGCTATQRQLTKEESPMANMKNLGMMGAGAVGMVAFTFGVAGLAGAQDDEPTLTDPSTDSVDAPSVGEGRPDRAERQQARVDRLIEDGVITQEQADELSSIREAIEANRETMQAEKQQAIADVLGVTLEELEAAKEDGTSLADLAGDNLDALVDHFTEQATERITEGVSEGRLTQEQADERLDGLADRIESRLENGGGFGTRGEGGRGGHGRHGGDFGTRGEGGRGHGRGGHGRHGGDFGPPGDDEAPAAEAQEASFT